MDRSEPPVDPPGVRPSSIIEQKSSATGWERLLSDESPEYVGLVYGLVLIWGLGDTVSTHFAYAAVGSAAGEANPWVAIMLVHNPLMMVVVKAAVLLYVGIILIEYRHFVQSVPGSQLWLSIVVVAGILTVTSNIVVGVLAVS